MISAVGQIDFKPNVINAKPHFIDLHVITRASPGITSARSSNWLLSLNALFLIIDLRLLIG